MTIQSETLYLKVSQLLSHMISSGHITENNENKIFISNNSIKFRQKIDVDIDDYIGSDEGVLTVNENSFDLWDYLDLFLEQGVQEQIAFPPQSI